KNLETLTEAAVVVPRSWAALFPSGKFLAYCRDDRCSKNDRREGLPPAKRINLTQGGRAHAIGLSDKSVPPVLTPLMSISAVATMHINAVMVARPVSRFWPVARYCCTQGSSESVRYALTACAAIVAARSAVWR